MTVPLGAQQDLLGQHALRRLATLVVATLTLIAALVLPATVAQAASSIDGPITRSEVLARAQTWVDRQVPYSQGADAADPAGKRYRTDCSGFVSMAWHLGLSENTTTLRNVSTRLASYDDLRPGDMINTLTARWPHVVLFLGWTDNTRLRAVIQEEPQDGQVAHETTYNRSYLQDNGYQPFRYNNIVDDPTTPPIAPRLGILDGAGQFLAKDGSLDAAWVNTAGGGRAMAVDGDRIGMIDTVGNLHVKNGGLNSAWVNVASDVVAFSLSGDRIGIVTSAGDAYVKDGSLSAEWTFLAHDIASITLAAERIGLIDRSGTVFVKEGSPDAPWSTLAHGAQQLVMTSNRVGVLTGDGHAMVKEGGLNTAWSDQSGGIVQMALGGNRIAVLDTTGVAYVKDGGLTTAWTQMGNQISRVEVTATRVGIIRNGEAWVKEGDLFAAWHVEANNVVALSLS